MTEPHFSPDQSWFSDCCGAAPAGELFRWTRMLPGGDKKEMAAGECSRCHEKTNFTQDETKTTTKG